MLDSTIDRTILASGLQLAAGIADVKSTMPVLANVLLRSIGSDGILLVASDLTVSLGAEIPSQNRSEGAILLGAKTFHGVVSNLSGVDLRLEESNGHRIIIRSGRSNFRLSGLSADTYPKIPDPHGTWFEVDASVFRSMLNKALHSVCKDATRFHLNGAYFESDGAMISMVSTDGHRLGKVEAHQKGPFLEKGVILPTKGMIAIKRVSSEAKKSFQIAVEPPYFFVKVGWITLTTKLIDAEYPPYEAILALDNDKRLVVARQALIEALRRTQIVAEESVGVRLTAHGSRIMIRGGEAGKDDAYELLDVEYGGPKVELALNPAYLCDLLLRMEDPSVVIEAKDSNSPVLLREKGSASYLGAVMPLRLS